MRRRAALGLALGMLFAVSIAAAERVAPTAAGVRPLEVGTTLPDVTLLNPAGQPVALHNVTGNGPVVLVFYRGGW